MMHLLRSLLWLLLVPAAVIFLAILGLSDLGIVVVPVGVIGMYGFGAAAVALVTWAEQDELKVRRS
jgi:hypothetical protein